MNIDTNVDNKYINLASNGFYMQRIYSFNLKNLKN